MKLVEIAGHLIDPGKVSYVGPLGNPDGTRAPDVWFSVVVDGAKAIWRFGMPMVARNARRDLAIAAVRSAQPEMTELEATHWRKSWPRIKPADADIAEAQKLMAEHVKASDGATALLKWNAARLGIEMAPDDSGNPSDALVGIENDDQIPLSCPFDCNEDIPNLACCRLCVATGMRTPRRA